MTPQFSYSPLTPQQTQQLGIIIAQCFVSPPNTSGTYLDRIGSDNFRVIYQAGQLAGGLAMLSMGQWWGGQSVPMTGIAAVGIAPEHRGSGAALALMQNLLQELHASGVPISVLYPATQRLYRQAGYEQAGSFCHWEIATKTIQMRQRSLPVHAVDPQNQAFFHPLYQQKAKSTNGHLDRNLAIWQEILRSDDTKPLFAYCLGAIERPEGYIIFQQRPDNGGILQVKDWATLTPAAAQTLWAFLGDHRFQIEKVQWKGAAIDPLTLLLPEQTPKLQSSDRWLLRIVNVRQALEKRGYPRGVETELHLEVQDDLLPANNGKFILSVANGQGKVQPGGKAELKLDIRGLAPLYTGLFSPEQLQLAGYLEAIDQARLVATQIFSGTSPFMPDFF